MKVDKVISEDEAALYDRQIRLWGVDAQRRLLSSRILLITMNGLGAEIAKNLVLSGINTLTIMDCNEVNDMDLKSNFLFSQTSLGKNRAESCIENLQILNPMVKILVEKSKFEDKDIEFFSEKNFDIVCALLDDFKALKKLNEACRNNNILFLSGFVYGLFGYMFVDFNEFKFITEATKVVEETAERKITLTNGKSCPVSEKQNDKLELEEKSVTYKSFNQFLENFESIIQNTKSNKMKRISKTYFLILLIVKFYEKYNRSFQTNSAEDLENLVNLKNTEFERLKIDQEIFDLSFLSRQNFEMQPSVNAILGGIIAQEIIKAISKKNEPIDNLFVFDGNQMSGEVIKI